MGKDSHIKGCINNVSRYLDCGAADYDVINRLDPLLHKYDIVVELSGAKWSKLEHLSTVIGLDSSLILCI